MAQKTGSHTGENVAWVNKVRAGSLPFQGPLKSELGGHGISVKLREWNVITLLNKTD